VSGVGMMRSIHLIDFILNESHIVVFFMIWVIHGSVCFAVRHVCKRPRGSHGRKLASLLSDDG
jgi:hypothetical protein